MTYNIKNLNVASLDFDNIKSSLISFFEQQNELKNLDFRNQASAANMLINILATATAYNGVYAQYGYVNSFASTATILQSFMGIASNNSVLLIPTTSAVAKSTVTPSTALADYTTFNAKSVNNSDLFFYNIEPVVANTPKSINLYCGSDVITYTSYDYTTQSCELPYNINPDTINFYETDVVSGAITKWTRVEKFNTVASSNNTHYTVKNGPQGYIVTNNFASSKQVTTSSKIEIKAVRSNGSLGNGATISTKSGVSLAATTTPSGGYNLISVAQAKASLLFKATGFDRCVTAKDYKNAIMASGISGTSDESLITVANTIYPGQVKVYVTGLSQLGSEQLLEYLSDLTPAGITVIYQP
jgi:hypothetical protein